MVLFYLLLLLLFLFLLELFPMLRFGIIISFTLIFLIKP